MKKLLLFVFAALAFAACTQDVVVDITPAPIVDEVPETLVVGFEGDDTRIQLNEAQKTVWTKGDLVSVFYKSDGNDCWKFTGETGERNGTLQRVSVGEYSRRGDYVIVAYPYNRDYLISLASNTIETTLPAVQEYATGSFGVGSSPMVAMGDYKQFALKNTCGWLKLQLTGNGEMVRSITLRGNNGEQVAGDILIVAEDASVVLADASIDIEDNEVGGSLLGDDDILKKVTLDCGEGVTLGAEATAFYIALPPQTFTQGLTVEITDDSGYTMTQATDKVVAIERNTIQPMAAIEVEIEKIPNNQIWYTSTDGQIVESYKDEGFDAYIVSNTYENGKGIITFNGDVTMIGEKAFFCCASLTSVNIPDSVTSIGDYAFFCCTSLTSVNVPDSVTSIGQNAFSSCESLISVNIPDSVTTIGDYAFQICDSLTSVTIGNSVTTIGEEAFSFCRSLKKVYCYATIPPSLGGSAFSSNASARLIYVYEECVELYKSAWSDYKDSIYTNGKNYPYTTTTTIQYTTNDGNTITSSKLPIISNIYDNGVGTLVVVGKISHIPNSAFRDCESLTSVNIPDNVTAIGSSAFNWCTSLTSVNIPDSVTTIGGYAFGHCTSLTSVNIPDSVTTIGEYAFQSCDSLTSVTIPDSVTTIGNCAFVWCTSLTSVNIPDSVTSIGNGAFSNCTSLTSVNIPDSVTTIGEYAFRNCDSLTSVTIPDSVTTIGNEAFYNCDSLTSVNIPDSVTTIGNEAFYDCDSLTSVTIPDSVTTIGNDAFYSCDSLTNVNIGDSVTTIGNFAFSRCYSLTSVNIPDSVTTIGNGAFYYCSNLTSVYCKATTPPALGGASVFDNNGSGRKIYVPVGSVNAYKSATNWSEYKSAIVGYDFENGVVVE